MALRDLFRRKEDMEEGQPNNTPNDLVTEQPVAPQNNIYTDARIVQTGFVKPIGKEQVQKATQILQKYKQGKANLERRIIENEQWYKLRHWECIDNVKRDIQPTSAWLFNSLANKHADAMDNFPAPNVLPREEGDKAEAEMLSSIIPVILDQNDFEEVYDEVWTYKLKTGTGCYGIFWDSSKLNGLGDVSIQKLDILNIFWEAGVTDIQKSPNLFTVELCNNDILEQTYPQLAGKLSTATVDVAKYNYDDSVDTTDKSCVIDWYYKKVVNGKKVLHYVKYVNDTVLYASENEPEYAERGYYDHAKYPLIFDPLFREEGTPAGFGYVDVGKSAQEYIDRSGQAILENLIVNAKPRFFVRNDGSVNENEYGDWTKDFVHVDGNLGQDSIAPITANGLGGVYVNVLQAKIEELKETTGNRDVSTGGSTQGVTAASAIAAMQEAGSKLSRDNNKAAYRVYRELCLMVIELIRQFYDLPRCFRIMGQGGIERFVTYSNAGIQPQFQGTDFGNDMGYRIPLFDIEVTAQKQSPYSKMSQNELALQFYNAGFFNPQLADQALACLDMMDFDRKEFIMQKIAQNGAMFQMSMQAQMMGAPMVGGEVQDGDDVVSESSREALGGEMSTEPAITKNARQRVAESTSPT